MGEKGVKINDIPTLFRVERNKKDYGNFLFNRYPYPNPQMQSDFDITYEWREW